MVRARVQGEISAELLMLIPRAQNNSVQLADAVLDGSGGACTYRIWTQNQYNWSVDPSNFLCQSVVTLNRIMSWRVWGWCGL